MDIHELIAAMKADRPQPSMIVEAIELLANQSPQTAHAVVDNVAVETTVGLSLDAIEQKMESIETRLAALEDKKSAPQPDYSALQSKLEQAEDMIKLMQNRLEEAEELLENRLAALEGKEESPQVKPRQQKKGKK